MVGMETTTTNGQVIIPTSVRRKLGNKNGASIQVEIDEEYEQIILTPITREYVHNLRGKFRGIGLFGELEASRERDRCHITSLTIYQTLDL